MKKMVPLHGMCGSMEAKVRGSAHHQEGGADSLLVPPHEK